MRKLFAAVVVLVVLATAVFVYSNLRSVVDPVPDTVAIPDEAYTDPSRPWWHGTVVYQIYPRSFQDSDGDGIGDLAGIASRLDYLQDLGVETIWLSPFFESPQADFGYDISDYRRVDPVYGDSLILSALIDDVHRRGMKIVFDLVLNHTSDQHPWFVESRSSRDNARSDWYVWRDGRGDGPPNNWHSALGTRAWHYDTTRSQWYYAAFLPFQPDLNYRNPAVRPAMLDVARYWLDRGADGFRLDIFNFLYESESLADNPFSLRLLPDHTMSAMKFQRKKYTLNQPETFDFARELRRVLDGYDPPRFMVGEVFGTHSTLRRLLGERGDGLHTVFLFSVSELSFTADFFREQIRAFEAFYPHPMQPTYVFSNHDRPRSITRLENDAARARLLAMLQLTVRGIPFIYQGEEIGMTTASIPGDDALDPLGREYSPISPGWAKLLNLNLNRDNVRTPMQWDDGPNGGFTVASARPWLPVQHNYKEINVASQAADTGSLLNTYRSLLQLRRSEPALRLGSLAFVEGSCLSRELLCYRREYGGRSMDIYLNMSQSVHEIGASGVVRFHVGSTGVVEGGLRLGPYAGVVVANHE